MPGLFDDEDERTYALMGDPWIGYSRLALWFCGVVYLLFACGWGPMFGAIMRMDPTVDPEVMGPVTTVVGVVAFVVCGGFALLNFLAAVGIGRGAMWGWVLTLVIGCMYLPSGCFPFGGVLLYGMLNERTRALFLKK